MDLTRVLEPEYCNSLLDTYSEELRSSGVPTQTARTYTRNQLRIVQIIAAIHETLNMDHLQKCIHKIQVLSSNPLSDPWYQESVDELREHLNEEKRKLRKVLRRVYKKDTVQPLEPHEIDHAHAAAKKALHRFYKTRDTMCMEAFHRQEALIEARRYQIILSKLS